MTIDAYEAALEPERERFARNPSVAALWDAGLETNQLELFLIHFSAMRASLAEFVPAWLRRAGRRSAELGYESVGRALVDHAGYEDGRHWMMAEGTRLLVSWWNCRHSLVLEAEGLVATTTFRGAEEYRALHEDVIESSAPFAEIALGYETETLSSRLGPRLIRRAVERVGEPIIESLSFLRQRIGSENERAAFHHTELARLLRDHPETLQPLIAAGARALAVYARFLHECWKRAGTVP